MVAGCGAARAREVGKMEEDRESWEKGQGHTWRLLLSNPGEPGRCGGRGELVGRGCGRAPRD